MRGIALAGGDKVISLSILRHVDASSEERAAYLKRANAVRRGTAEEEAGADAEEGVAAIELGEKRYVELSAAEQFVLTLSERGYGKRSSSYEYRTTGRGGKGIVAMSVNNRNGKLVASFPVEDGDQIMLVTDRGQLIRCPVHDVRIAKSQRVQSEFSKLNQIADLAPNDVRRSRHQQTFNPFGKPC